LMPVGDESLSEFESRLEHLKSRKPEIADRLIVWFTGGSDEEALGNLRQRLFC
jgi:hypothetical protein